MTKLSARAQAHTQRTVQSYEGFARQYDELVNAKRPPHIEDALRRFVQCLPPGGTVLEIGSGTGRDADFIESLGVAVRRTDATQAFLDLMTERGQQAELLNVMTDALGGPHDGVLAMGVLIHVDREQIDPVLGKVHTALKPGGAFLVAMRKGEGETNHDGYHTVQWTGEHFAERLAAAGLSVAWRTEWWGRDGNEWVTFLARRAV